MTSLQAKLFIVTIDTIVSLTPSIRFSPFCFFFMFTISAYKYTHFCPAGNLPGTVKVTWSSHMVYIYLTFKPQDVSINMLYIIAYLSPASAPGGELVIRIPVTVTSKISNASGNGFPSISINRGTCKNCTREPLLRSKRKNQSGQ